MIHSPNRTSLSRTIGAAVALFAGIGAIHGPARLEAQRPSDHPSLVSVETARCADCHEDLVKAAAVHAPAADDCTICHEVSITGEGTTVALVDGEPSLCLMCHDEKTEAVELTVAAPHLPVGDSCLTCHAAHASDGDHLLLEPVPAVCTQCHDLDDLATAHDGQLTAATGCGSCHEPHGNHNERMLRAARLHPPFADGSCSGCHREPFGERIRLRARGERLCTACHGEFERTAGGSVHAALESTSGRAGCLSCHDPHMSNAGAVLVRDGPALCGECHGGVVGAAAAANGHPPAADDCLICHLPHTSPQPRLLAEPRDGLCAICHDLEPPPAAGPAVAGSLDGAGRARFGPAPVVAAADFDNGTDAPGLCAAPFPAGTWSGEIVVCERGEVRRVLKGENVKAGGAGGLVLVNRPGGADDVFADPHALPAIHLTAAAAASLHGWRERGGGPATIDGSTLLLSPPAAPTHAEGDLAAAHLGADLARLDCVTCHTPHGEGHPKLLARHVHAPLEDGCDTCHEGAYDRLMEGGAPELCLFCHDDVGEAARQATVPHDALEVGSCTDCHNPHASAQERLVSSPGAGPCADCHDEQTAGPGEVAHGVVELIGCRACHEPHGGGEAKLLRRTGAELCLSCHPSGGLRVSGDAETAELLGRFEVPAAVAAAIAFPNLSPDGTRDHPVAGHRALGVATEEEIRGARVETSFSGELTCLTCHDPHKGRSAKILRWQAATASEACLACHKKK